MSEGRRNSNLTKLAGYLRRAFNFNEQSLYEAINALNLKAVSPLDDGELRAIARSIGNKPGGVRPDFQDVPMARHVAEALQGRCCHVAEWGWLTYDGTVWCADISGIRTRERVARELEALLEVCKATGDADLIKSARAIQATSKVNAIMSLIAGDHKVSALVASFDADKDLLNLANGTLNLATGELQKHDPLDLLTKHAETAFDAEAECPHFDKLLADTLPREHRAFVLRLLGYALLGRPVEQVFAIFHGIGANGKSTFVNAVADLLGDYSTSVEPSSFIKQKGERIRNDLARLRGARLVATSELATGEILDAALVKRFTGGDTITVRALYKEHFEFKAEFLVLMTTNALPVIDGADNALARRIVLVPFSNVIPEQDRDNQLPDKLRAEGAGILNRLLEGLDDYKRNGLSIPTDIQAAAASYVGSSDMIAEFLDDEYERVQGASEGAAVVFASYQRWCGSKGLRPMSQPQFKPELVKKLGQQIHTKKGSTWPGIRRRTKLS